MRITIIPSGDIAQDKDTYIVEIVDGEKGEYLTAQTVEDIKTFLDKALVQGE